MENSIPKGVVKNNGDLGGELLQGGAGASKLVEQPEVATRGSPEVPPGNTGNSEN